MSQCPPLPAYVLGNGSQIGDSSISSQHLRTGGTVSYTTTIIRTHFSNGNIGTLGLPGTYLCPGSVACTLNGVACEGSDGTWYIPASINSEWHNYSDPAASFTFTATFTLGSTYTSCLAHVGSSGVGFFDYHSVSILAHGELELDEENRNKKKPCDSVCHGTGTARFAELATYNSDSASDPPGSLGWGWTMSYNKSVAEDSANQDLLYYDGSGSFERWKKLSNGSYVARYPDNHATLTKAGSGPVVITLKNKTVLTFRTVDGKIGTEVDRNGNTITYNYDTTSGLLTSVSDGEGRVIYFDYGSRSDGQPVSIRQQDASTGRLTSLDYYSNGRLWKVTSSEGDVNELVYDSNGLLWKKIDPRGKVEIEYTYDSGKVATATFFGERMITQSYDTGPDNTKITTIVEEDLTLDPDPNPRTTVMTFDLHSRLIRKVDPLGNVFLYHFEDQDDPYLLTEQVDPNGFSTLYDYVDGNLVSVTDAQGNATLMTYSEGYLLASVQRPSVTVEGVVILYELTELDYDAYGNLLSVTDMLDGNPVSTVFTVRSDGRIESVTNRVGQTTEFEYTTQSGSLNAGNLRKITLPAGPNSAPAREILFDYNAYDEKIKTTDPGGNEVNFQFDDDGRLEKVTDSLNNEVNYHYLDGLLDYIDLPANQGSSTNSRRTRFTFDDPGRVLQVLSKISTTQEEMRVKKEYDGRSNLKKLIRLKRDTSNSPVEKAYEFSYDILDRPLEALDPLSGLSTVEHSPYCQNFTTRSARGVETQVSRDSLCRVTEVANSDQKREFFYDELSRLVSVVQTHNPAPRYVDPDNLPTDRPPSRFGQVRYGEAEVSETTTYLYDELSRLSKITFPDSQTVLYEYDQDGRVTKVTDMLSNETQYTYYNDGRLYQVTAKATGGDQVFTYSYDTAGRPYEIQYPSASGLVAKFYDASNNSGWDANGRLTCLRYLKSSSLVQSFEYGYDASGNRTSMVETPASGPAITWGYFYDWLDRLTRVYKDSVQQSVYVYDESDNRLELQRPVLSETHSYTYDFADRILARLVNSTPTETFSHDDDGNMIARTAGGVTTNYTWDFSDKLTSIQKSSFQETYRYDSEGIRKSKGTNTRYFSSGAASLADLLPTNSISYIQGHQLLGMLQGGNYYWYISDGLGTVRMVMPNSSSTTPAATYSSDEFGRQTAVTGSADQRQHTYTGGLGVRNEVGSDSQLLYARQRWYDPGSGRWLNQDPIGFAGGLNLFTYCNNNPILGVDPVGLIPITISLGPNSGLSANDLLALQESFNKDFTTSDKVTITFGVEGLLGSYNAYVHFSDEIKTIRGQLVYGLSNPGGLDASTVYMGSIRERFSYCPDSKEKPKYIRNFILNVIKHEVGGHSLGTERDIPPGSPNYLKSDFRGTVMDYAMAMGYPSPDMERILPLPKSINNYIQQTILQIPSPNPGPIPTPIPLP